MSIYKISYPCGIVTIGEGIMATIKQVAELAGVGTSTVSRYLNSNGYISDDAKERIKEACEKLNYMPNELARAMKLQHSKTIGVMIPTICNPFFTQLVHVIEQSLLLYGYKTVLCNTNGDIELEKNYLNLAISNRFDGIILITGSEEFMHLETEIPIILLDRISEVSTKYINLTSNNRQGAELAAEHLIECGCTKILYITADEDIIPSRIREKAFGDIMNERGIEYIIKKQSELDVELFERAISNGVDGIFAWNDIIAIQCISYCAEKNISIPEQVQLMGYDNIDLTELVHPKLTTVAQPLSKLGILASKYMVELIDGNINAPIEVQLDNNLIIRESTQLK